MNKFMTRACATGLALALAAAPLAMAQDSQHGDPHGGNNGAAEAARPAEAPGHSPEAPGRAASGPTHNATSPARPTGNTGHEMRAAPAQAPGRSSMQTDHNGGDNRGPAEANRGGGDHSWHTGSHYSGGRDVVDYNRYHLHRPPHGYEWVRDGNQFILIGISTGIIASVLAARGY